MKRYGQFLSCEFLLPPAFTAAQTRLNNANAAIPHLQAEVTAKQQTYDTAVSRTKELGHFFNDMWGPGRNAVLQAGLAVAHLKWLK